MSEKEPPEEEGATPTKPSVKRTSTMAQTAKVSGFFSPDLLDFYLLCHLQEGEEFLERQAKQAKLDENGDKTAAEATEAEA